MTTFRKSIATVLLGLVASAALADVTLLNASYDVARDVYKDYNPMFQKYWKAKAGESVELKQSHGGSTKQVRAVADGLEADVVTMNQANDIEFLAERSLVAKDWAKKFPNNASPYTSAMVFIVRKGNPKQFKDCSPCASAIPFPACALPWLPAPRWPMPPCSTRPTMSPAMSIRITTRCSRNTGRPRPGSRWS